MNGSDVIQAFGGLSRLSEITGANRRAVEQWKRIGIPAKYWHKLVAEAAVSGLPEITFDALQATKRPSSEEVAA